MTSDDKKIVIDILGQILQDNLQSKLTFALATGILNQLDTELSKQVQLTEMLKNTPPVDNPLNITTEKE